VAVPAGTVPAAVSVGIVVVPQIKPLDSGVVVPLSGVAVATTPLVLNGTFAFFSSVVHSNTAAFTVAVRVTQATGDNGYLFAQSQPASVGASINPNRVYGLYAGTSSLTFYYRGVGTTAVSRVRFAGVSVSDGKTHTVVLSVNAHTVHVRVDTTYSGSHALISPVEACSDCVLVVGGRIGQFGTSVHRLAGSISEIAVYPWPALDTLPTMPRDPFTALPTPAHTLFADLAGNRHLSLLASNQMRLKGGASFSTALRTTTYNTVTFDGNGGGLLLAQPLLTLPFTYSVNLTLSSGSAGFIFAKTDASATRRYSALYYSRVSRALRYFYSFAGQTEVVTFSSVQLDDGLSHSILLSVTGGPPLAQVHLRVDGSTTAFVQSLRGVPEDCGATSPGCLTYIGQRADDVDGLIGGRFGIVGEIRRLLFYPSLLVADPAITEGLERFSKTERRYVAGRNEGGEFTSGVPLADCVTRCLQDPLCQSFDAGRLGTAFTGACFVSHTTQLNGTLRISEAYDYYELVNE
jgi:hypothetical protein